MREHKCNYLHYFQYVSHMLSDVLWGIHCDNRDVDFLGTSTISIAWGEAYGIQGVGLQTGFRAS